MKKEVLIKINKEFIEKCVYQEDWGEIKLDNEELNKNISEYIKTSTEDIVRNVVRDVVLEIVKKDLKKEVKEKVKSFIVGMSDTELFYRDEFRLFLIEIAKENKKKIDEKIKAFLENDDKVSSRLADAIGCDMNSRFFDAIVNGKVA